MTSVLIADHHPITRKGISSLLLDTNTYDILGEVSNGDEMFSLLRKTKPDLLIMELDLPQINGITAIKTLKQEFKGIKIIIFSTYPEEIYALSTIKAGASAYLSKTIGLNILQTAIERVTRGGIYLNEDLTEKLAHGSSNSNNLAIKYKKLSSREVEVLNLLSSGKRNKDIASALSINEKTVSTYKTRLLKKLKVHNVADLIHQSRLLQIN